MSTFTTALDDEIVFCCKQNTNKMVPDSKTQTKEPTELGKRVIITEELIKWMQNDKYVNLC